MVSSARTVGLDFRLAGFGRRRYDYAVLFGYHDPHSDFRGKTRPVKDWRLFDIAGASPRGCILCGVPQRLCCSFQAINCLVGLTARVVGSTWNLFACFGDTAVAVALWHYDLLEQDQSARAHRVPRRLSRIKLEPDIHRRIFGA